MEKKQEGKSNIWNKKVNLHIREKYVLFHPFFHLRDSLYTNFSRYHGLF